jgi:hypothetical protein
VNSLAELVGIEPGLGEEVADTVRHRMRLIEVLLAEVEAQGQIHPALEPQCGERVAYELPVQIRDEQELWLMCELHLTGLGLGPECEVGAT